MTRPSGAALLFASVALALAACSGDDASSAYAYSGDACNQFTSCGSCTPVEGCGWCFNASGGLCAATPDECTNVSEFTWTWDSTGCPDTDASVVPVSSSADAGGGGG
ncbi:MAG: hypothetical protein ACRELB_18585 [Polyangiaceae bacterium]